MLGERDHSMNRLQQRLADLEKAIAPKGRDFVFLSFDDPKRPPYAEQLAAFHAENDIAPNDTVHEVRVTFS
jgi:hypothetical protein